MTQQAGLMAQQAGLMAQQAGLMTQQAAATLLLLQSPRRLHRPCAAHLEAVQGDDVLRDARVRSLARLVQHDVHQVKARQDGWRQRHIVLQRLGLQAGCTRSQRCV